MRVVLLLPLAFAACAAGQRLLPAEAGPAHEVRGSMEAVWRVLPAVFDSLEIPVTDRQIATRTIGNSGVRLRGRLGDVSLSRYLDCGATSAGPNAATYEVHFQLQTVVQAGAREGTAQLNTIVQPMARPAAGEGEWVTCTSTGTLEARILELTKALVAR